MKKWRHFRVDCLLPFFALFVPYLNILKTGNYNFFSAAPMAFAAILAAIGMVFGLLAVKTPAKLSSFILALFTVVFIDTLLFNYWLDLKYVHIFMELALVGLLAFVFYKFRRDFSLILGVFFIVIMVSTAVLSITGEENETRSSVAQTNHEGRRDLSIIIHLVLDEQIAVEGIEATSFQGQKIRNETINFYTKNNFQLYGGAISHFPKTHLSLGHMLNFKMSPDPVLLKHFAGERKFTLAENQYFDELENRGYKIIVYDSYYFGLCPASDPQNFTCKTYNHESLSSIEKFPLSLKEKVSIIGGVYLSLIPDFRWVKIVLKKLEGQQSKPQAVEADSDIEGFSYKDFIFPFILPSFSVYEEFLNDVQKAQPGEMYFVHLMAPHFPYVFDESCQLYPLSKWVMNKHGIRGKLWGNTGEGREARYRRYLEQLSCVNHKIASLMDALRQANLLDNTIIIIHSDHGSRISIHEPYKKDQGEFSSQDIRDTYLSHFAVRLPWLAGGYNKETVSIHMLLENLLLNKFLAHSEIILPEKPYSVYLESHDETSMIELSYPENAGNTGTEN